MAEEEAEVKLGSLTVADEAEIKLFTTKFSSFGQRVEIVLKEKHIPFQTIIVDLTNKPQELLDANPIHKKVPTIIHNGKPLAESLVILEYLEETFPEVPLMPKGAYERAKFRFWIDYIYKIYSTLGRCVKFKPETPECQAAFEAYMNNLKTLEEGMASFSADGPFFAGEEFGLIDVASVTLGDCGPLVQALSGLATPGPDELPRFHKWCKAVREHPSVKSTVASPEETLRHNTEYMLKRSDVAAAAEQSK